MRATKNNILLQFETALQEKLKFKSGVELFIPSFLNREEHASVIAEVVATGDECALDYKVNGETFKIKAGDKVAVSYHVVSKYTMDKSGAVTYHNCYRVNGRDVWKANDSNIMAVQVGGKWIGVGEWVLMTEVFKEPEVKSSLLVLPDSLTKPVLIEDRGQYFSGDIDVPENSILAFDPKYRSVYRIDTDLFIILRASRIIGIETNKAATA